MSPIAVFLTGIIITVTCSFAVVRYLRPSLEEVLVDLCGTAPRAAFWAAFSNVTIGLTPVMFAMHYRPEGTDTPAIFALVGQVEWALAGLLLSVVALGFVLSRFIIRQPVPR
jgi:hypothetical protein